MVLSVYRGGGRAAGEGGGAGVAAEGASVAGADGVVGVAGVSGACPHKNSGIAGRHSNSHADRKVTFTFILTGEKGRKSSVANREKDAARGQRVALLENVGSGGKRGHLAEKRLHIRELGLEVVEQGALSLGIHSQTSQRRRIGDRNSRRRKNGSARGIHVAIGRAHHACQR